MKTIGIIAEFNPFHNGHKYLINRAKKITGADNVVVVCSGNYVQRGMPSIWDKQIRTKMALLNGADAVFELPFFYSTASAELFARAAIRFLTDLNCVDYLCFGCESDNLKALPVISTVLAEEPDEYKEYLSEALKTGVSFPKARICALRKYCSLNNIFHEEDLEQLLVMPNNILAIEYLKAIKLFHSPIKPVAIKRVGAGYHSVNTEFEFASATGIRKYLHNNDFEKISGYIPENCIDLASSAKNIALNDFDTVLGSMLIAKDDFSDIYGINTELSNRINHQKPKFVDTENFIAKLQSKNYTYSAVSRALLHISLDLKVENVEEFINNGYFTFARLLGFRKKSNILSSIKENSDLDIISKLSGHYKEAQGISKKMMDLSLKADHLYRMIYMNKYDEYIPTEFERQIIVL